LGQPEKCIVAAVLIVSTLLCAAGAEAVERHNWFIHHHSVGRNIIDLGDIRGMITALNAAVDDSVELWNHDYNHIGLKHPDGVIRAPHYNIPYDTRTTPGMRDLWVEENGARELILENHQLIGFKLGYYACSIETDQELDDIKNDYLQIRDQLDTYLVSHPDRLFFVITPSPLHWRSTTHEEAARARAFCDWLKSPEYLAGHPNLATFDLFDLLAYPPDHPEHPNKLHLDWTNPDLWDDSHPTDAASVMCAGFLFDFMVEIADGIGVAAGPAPAVGPRLLPNSPNPFNPVTWLRFDLPRPAATRLDVYDLSGRLVCSLLDGATLAEGRHEVAWNGRDPGGREVAAGVYVYRLRADGWTAGGRMTLLK